MTTLHIRIAIFVAFFMPFEVYAFNITELSFEQKAKQADLIIIAEAVGPEIAKNSVVSVMQLRPISVLKGKPPQKVMFLTRTGIAELSPNCCEIGETYFFMLKKTRSGEFVSVNARFGVYPVLEKSGLDH
jgi:hypothetical protein